MNIYISINGVLRNLIQKFEYTYRSNFQDSDFVGYSPIEIDNNGNLIPVDNVNTTFEYKVSEPISNDNLLNYFSFQSVQEYENFVYLESPLEIFGHSNISYPTVFSDLSIFIKEHKNDKITLIGMDELGRAKPATLFFLAKNGCVADNIRFIRTEDIAKEWKHCDIWITDDPNIIKAKTNKRKKAILFRTAYNSNFKYHNEISKINSQPKP